MHEVKLQVPATCQAAHLAAWPLTARHHVAPQVLAMLMLMPPAFAAFLVANRCVEPLVDLLEEQMAIVDVEHRRHVHARLPRGAADAPLTCLPAPAGWA